MPRLLIYGANGYTGELISREAADAGLHPVLAGRNEEAVRKLANELSCEHAIFDLDDPPRTDSMLKSISVVLNCAGPFSRTALPLATACMHNGTQYLDITGEIGVFESLAAQSERAKASGVMLLPGVGFDVVPTDCLAAYLKARLPEADTLVLAILGSAGVSRGTATTVVENLHQGGCVRRAGRLQKVPAAWKTRLFDFGTRRPKECITFPWGDVSTAWYSTRIPNIEVYMAVPPQVRKFMRFSRYLGPLLKSAPVQGYLKKRIEKGPRGPNLDQRKTGMSIIWGEVTESHGGRVVARLRTPEGYALTVQAALAAAKRVLAGDVKPGFQTPSLAFGADFVMTLDGVVREDLDASRPNAVRT